MPEEKSNKSLKYGYIVGVDGESNELVFEVLGKDPGIIELMGCHEFAKYRVHQIRDIVQDDGSIFMKKSFAGLGKLQEMLIHLLTGLYSALDKPLPLELEALKKKEPPKKIS